MRGPASPGGAHWGQASTTRCGGPCRAAHGRHHRRRRCASRLPAHPPRPPACSPRLSPAPAQVLERGCGARGRGQAAVRLLLQEQRQARADHRLQPCGGAAPRHRPRPRARHSGAHGEALHHRWGCQVPAPRTHGGGGAPVPGQLRGAAHRIPHRARGQVGAGLAARPAGWCPGCIRGVARGCAHMCASAAAALPATPKQVALLTRCPQPNRRPSHAGLLLCPPSLWRYRYLYILDNALTTYTADASGLGDGKPPVPPCILSVGNNTTQVGAVLRGCACGGGQETSRTMT